jgi:hypothetical protein
MCLTLSRDEHTAKLPELLRGTTKPAAHSQRGAGDRGEYCKATGHPAFR